MPYEMVSLLRMLIDRDGSAVLGTQWRTLPDILSAEDVAALQAIWLDALREVLREVTS